MFNDYCDDDLDVSSLRYRVELWAEGPRGVPHK